MEKKIAVYICTGCGMGDALDIEQLVNVATDEHSVPICKTHLNLCSEEGAALIKNDIDNEGANTLIMANAVICGGTSIGPDCWIAPNSVIKQSLRIGRAVTVGLGAVVLRDVPDELVVAGVPARFPRPCLSPPETPA